MASILKTPSGYQAQVYMRGVRKAKSFRTKREASAWSFETEERLRSRSDGTDTHTLREAFERFRDEVSPGRRGERWEIVRITKFLADPLLPCGKPIQEVTPEELAEWRDARLKVVSAGTVLRDFGLLSAILEIARREWRWLVVNPVADVRKPRSPDHREVTIELNQIKAMLKAMAYRRGSCRSVSQAVASAFLFALRTGMRAGEVCALKWCDVKDGYVRVAAEDVGAGKTSSARRDVPMIYQTERIVRDMEGWDNVLVFGITTRSLDALFRKYRLRSGLDGFTFHDSRHTAATWLSRKLDVLTLCKMFGWKNTKQALTYYNPKPSDIRRLLEPNRSR